MGHEQGPRAGAGHSWEVIVPEHISTRDAGVAAGLPAPADVLLRDGSTAVIRPAAPGDAAALGALHEGVCDDNLRLRFFSASRRAARQYVEHLARESDGLVLVAEHAGRLVAVASAEPAGPEVAEVAFLVDDELHGVGLGSLLLEHLAAAGRTRGLRRFVAEVLAENRAMLGVFLDAGFTISRRFEAGCVKVAMDTAATAAAVAAADERECLSEARSLQPLLYPRSVAVVGVRRDGSGIGAAVLRSVVAGGFVGHLYAVHPRADRVEGVEAFPTMVAVPSAVDLAVIAVPATAVLTALADAADAGVPAAVVLSSGFEELGEEGARLQREMLALARRRSVRIVGPNCLGLMSNLAETRLNATFSGCVPPPGGLAVASQSGGVGIVLMDVARRLDLGVGSFVSLGNKADVSGNDLLAAWHDDPRVTAAALYLESFGNAPKFARFARRFAERKPLLAVVGGRSAGGRRGGASHTAAAASPAVAVAALFAQAGVVACDGAEDMAEAALFFAQQPLPEGRRVAVLSNAGGMGVLAADAADDVGLVVPELSPELRDRIAGHVSGTSGTGNPVDAGAGGAPEDVGALSDLLLGSTEVDALLVVLVATVVGDSAAAMHQVAAARGRHPDKPVLLVPLGGLSTPPGGLPGITTYASIEAGLRALARAVRYADWRASPPDVLPVVDADRADRARRVAADLMGRQRGADSWLDPGDQRRLLDDYGLAPVGRLAPDSSAAVAAAAELGYPVALKVADHDVVHKTDRGLVRLGLGSAAEVLAACRGFAGELGRDGPVLVQPMASGVEIALGVVRDARFGPLVMVAAGGVATELWEDRVFLLPPITARDAARAVRSLRVRPLLEGYRGSPAVDMAGLEQLIVQVGRLAEDVPQLVELDLNPVLVGTGGCTLVDVKARLTPAAPLDAGIPRRLRRDL
jgi:acyl-CoA synthetase (NDP forming)/L-amino acid N-acyltransferase YncA